MKILYSIIFLLIIGGALFIFLEKDKGVRMVLDTISLPKPKKTGNVAVEKAISLRRSVRSYKNQPISLDSLSQLLWSAQGITSSDGLRSTPSAGALYPLEIYVVAGNVDGLSPGIYKYDCKKHVLEKMKDGDFREKLCSTCIGQTSVRLGAVCIVITAVYERTSRKYEDRAERYVHIEVGHVAQNVFLQSVSLGLSMVVVGAFDDNYVKELIGAESDEEPLYVLPIGFK